MVTPLPKVSAPAQRALASRHIESIEDLAKLPEKDIAALHGMGPNALGKLKAPMALAG
jgi:hypothetical protein